MPKQIKICPVCGIGSKALHLHMRKHKTETKPNVEAVEPVVAEPIQTEPLEGKDIPITPEMTETPAEVGPVTNVNNCEYFLEMSFNGETLQCYTNNLDVSIQLFSKPVLTEMFVKVAKNNQGDPFIKKLTLIQAKQLFNDPQNREMFLGLYYGLYGKPQTEQKLNNMVGQYGKNN
jgi:hypothetical protein